MTSPYVGDLATENAYEGTVSSRPGGGTLAIGSLLVVALAGLLVVRALELRVPEMTRPFWEDEVHHNHTILASADMRDLQQHHMYLSMYHPLFDFWARKVFWFPLLGINERAMRMPALVYGVALVLLVYGFALISFAHRMRLWWAALLAFCAALWMVNNPTMVHYSAEARHYSLIAFASTLWCGLLFLHEGRPRFLFATATLLFANVHFFSLPMIAGGYVLVLLREARRREFRWIPFHLLVCFAVFACTRWINYGPFYHLLYHTPTALGVVDGTLRHPLGMPVFKAAFDVWLDYAKFVALPPAAWAVWLAMLLVVAIRRASRWIPFLVVMFLALPAFFLYVRIRSDLPFRPPYFSVFTGLGLVSLLGALGFGLDGLAWLARRLSPGRLAGAAGVGFAVVALGLGLPAFARHLITERDGIHRVAPNFSPYFLAYGEIAKEAKPVFVLHNHCWTDNIPTMYFNHVIPQDGVFRTTADALGCETRIPLARERLSAFLREYGPRGGFVVLDQKEESCRDRPVPPILFPGTVEKVTSVQDCMWKIRGARSLEELGVVAATVGFRAEPGFF
jgi:hypothetical protein